MWYRVFGKTETAPDIEKLLEELFILGIAPRAVIRSDEQGWLGVEFTLTEGATPLNLERYLSSEPDIRHELNTWAAMLETMDYSPNHVPLMQHMISTKQVFTLRKPIDHPNEVLLDKACIALCQYLSGCTDGVYQEDGQGFFAADGTLLLQEY
jgi:hypothetical protein